MIASIFPLERGLCFNRAYFTTQYKHNPWHQGYTYIRYITASTCTWNALRGHGAGMYLRPDFMAYDWQSPLSQISVSSVLQRVWLSAQKIHFLTIDKQNNISRPFQVTKSYHIHLSPSPSVNSHHHAHKIPMAISPFNVATIRISTSSASLTWIFKLPAISSVSALVRPVKVFCTFSVAGLACFVA